MDSEKMFELAFDYLVYGHENKWRDEEILQKKAQELGIDEEEAIDVLVQEYLLGTKVTDYSDFNYEGRFLLFELYDIGVKENFFKGSYEKRLALCREIVEQCRND